LNVFKKKKKSQELDENVAMRIVAGGKARDVSYRELLLSTNLSMEALMSVLVKKKLISPEDLFQEIEEIRKTRYKGPAPLEPEEKPSA
jgi:hypothetical protein